MTPLRAGGGGAGAFRAERNQIGAVHVILAHGGRGWARGRGSAQGRGGEFTAALETAAAAQVHAATGEFTSDFKVWVVKPYILT